MCVLNSPGLLSSRVPEISAFLIVSISFLYLVSPYSDLTLDFCVSFFVVSLLHYRDIKNFWTNLILQSLLCSLYLGQLLLLIKINSFFLQLVFSSFFFFCLSVLSIFFLSLLLTLTHCICSYCYEKSKPWLRWKITTCSCTLNLFLNILCLYNWFTKTKITYDSTS